MCMSSPSVQAPAAPVAAAPPPPTVVDPSVVAARQSLIAQAASAQGRASTIVAQDGPASTNTQKTLTGQ